MNTSSKDNYKHLSEVQNQQTLNTRNSQSNLGNQAGATTAITIKKVKHVRFEQSQSNSDGNQDLYYQDKDTNENEGQQTQIPRNVLELSNNYAIDKYNKHRYDAPTYLTVQTLSQIERESLLIKEKQAQRDPVRQQMRTKTKDGSKPGASSESRSARTKPASGGGSASKPSKQFAGKVSHPLPDQSTNSNYAFTKYAYPKNLNVSTTKVFSAQSNSSRQQVLEEEDEGFQDVHSFEGSSFEHRKGKDKYEQNKTYLRQQQACNLDAAKEQLQQHSVKYDDIMQSIDESQLGFVNGNSDEMLRTHSDLSNGSKIVTPSQVLDQPTRKKSDLSTRQKPTTRSPIKTVSPKDQEFYNKNSLQKEIEMNNTGLIGAFEDGDQSFDEKQFYLRFKSSVLQDLKVAGNRMMPQGVTYSGPQSGLQSGAISQNATPETSNNVPLQLLQQVKSYSPYCEDQASIYYQDINPHFSHQPSLALNNQQMDSQIEFKEENTFDFLSSYQSDKDEDYSEKEDLIMNKKFYAKDLHKPFEKNISKAEVQCLLKDQQPIVAEYPSEVVDESSLMALPYNFRDKDKIIGKRTYHESSMMNSNQKEPGMGSYQQFDNGYTEYLLQSQNIQNSLLNNFQVNLPENSIEPIITRYRGRQNRDTVQMSQYRNQECGGLQQIVRGGCIHSGSPSKPQGAQRSEKSFSFCNSLGDTSMNHERSKAERSRRANEKSYREQKNSKKIVQNRTQVNGPSYQKNYYYNFNNNYNGVLPPSMDQEKAEASQPSRQIKTKCVEVQVSPTMIDDEDNKPSPEQVINFQNVIQQQIPQFFEYFASKKKRGRKAKTKQNTKTQQTKVTMPEQQEVFNTLTSQISKIYGAGNKTLTKDELAQIGQYQVMLMQFIHQKLNFDDKEKQENNQTKKLQVQFDFGYGASLQRPFQQQSNPNQQKIIGYPQNQQNFQSNQFLQPQNIVEQHLPSEYIQQRNRQQPTAFQMPASKTKASPQAPPPEEKINFFFNEQLVEIIKQLDMYIQLLYQVLILMKQTDSDSKKKYKKDKHAKPKEGEQDNLNLGVINPTQHDSSEEDIFIAKTRQKHHRLSNPEIKDGLKYQLYHLLYDMIKRREDAINQFKLDHNITPRYPIPKYEVPWISYWMEKSENMLKGTKRSEDELVFTTMPQISYFQVPLLEFAPQVIDTFLNPYPIKECNNPTNVFLRMRPLLNQNLLPINTNRSVKRHMMFKPPPSAQSVLNQIDHSLEVSDIENECIDPFDSFFDPVFMSEKEYYMYGSLDFKKKYQVYDYQNTCQQEIVFPYASNTRRKFSMVDDNFLIMAITNLGSPKDFESINMYWLMHKTQSEIKHRLKNLTCLRAPDNIIKRWKMQFNMPLRQGWMTKEGALGTKVVKPRFQAGEDDLESHKSKHSKSKDADQSDQESGGEDESSNNSGDESDEGKSQRHAVAQKATRNKKLYYYNEMRNLALGIKWFGTRSLSQETLKNLLDKYLSMDKKNINLDVDPLYLQPHNIEKLIHMSQLSRWNQISKYFIPSRSGEFIKLEYSNIVSNPDKCNKFTAIMKDSPDFKTFKEIEHSKQMKEKPGQAAFTLNKLQAHLLSKNDKPQQWSNLLSEARTETHSCQDMYKFKSLFNIIESSEEVSSQQSNSANKTEVKEHQ